MGTQAMLARAEQAKNAGNNEGARQILDHLVMEDPRNEQAWIILSKVVAFRNEEQDCLAQVLAINPNNQEAKARFKQLSPPAKPDHKKKRRER